MNLRGRIAHLLNRYAYNRLRRKMHKAGRLAAHFERTMRRMHLPREERKRHWIAFRETIKKYAGE